MAKKINPRTILTRHQVYLERLKAGYVKTNDDFIRQSSEVMTEIIQALKVENMSELTRKGLKQLLADIRDKVQPIYVSQTERMIDDLMELADSEALFEQQLITEIGGAAGLPAKLFKRTKKVWEFLVTKPLQATGDLLEPFIKDLSARQIKRINQEVNISVSQGRTISQTVQAIRGTKARNYKDGIISMNSRDARTVVRTATQQVSQTAREAIWEANRDLIDRYQIVATLDGRTSPQCRSLDQQVFEIGRGPVPPLHPGCRTATVPYFEPSVWDEGATRSSLNGPVDQKTTYYEWLKDQPASFQDDAIGPTRGKLLRNGGLTSEEFADLQLDKNFQPLTLDEMRKLNPNAFERANI